MRTSPSMRTFPAARAAQTGATLIVGLVLLLVLTVLGVSGMNTATMEVNMAGNVQFQQDAFQLAEDAIDIVLATRNYTTDEDLPVDWLGNPEFDRRAITRWTGQTTPVPDEAFSEGAVAAYHFDVTAVGRSPRSGSSVHTQSFYVVGQGGN